eukprot:1763863-Karenia_brevis.AAC.1
MPFGYDQVQSQAFNDLSCSDESNHNIADADQSWNWEGFNTHVGEAMDNAADEHDASLSHRQAFNDLSLSDESNHNIEYADQSCNWKDFNTHVGKAMANASHVPFDAKSDWK